MRLAKATACTNIVEDKTEFALPKQTYSGDSWFISVQVVAGCSLWVYRYIRILTTAHSSYPKKFIQETIEKWPSSGSHLLLQTTIAEEVDLCAYGYEFNSNCSHSQKVQVIQKLVFCTKHCGRTRIGTVVQEVFCTQKFVLSVSLIATPLVFTTEDVSLI